MQYKKQKGVLLFMIYLIDFENVHEEGFSSLGRLGDKDAVYCFFTRNVAKISMSALAGIRSGQLHFIEAESGKQSLDLVLVSYLGYLIGTRPQELYYDIISNDNGFGKVADFWNKRGNGLRVRIRKTNEANSRNETLKNQPASKPEAASQSSDQQYSEELSNADVQSSAVSQTRQKSQVRQARRRQGRTSGKQRPQAALSVELPSEQAVQKETENLVTNASNVTADVPELSVMTIESSAQKSAQNNPAEENATVQKDYKPVDPAVLSALEAAGINSSATEFLQNQIEKYRADHNMKQLVYRAVVRKYGQKAGTQIYNNAKKLLMK